MVSWGLMRFRWAISGNALAMIMAIMSVDFNLFMVFFMVSLVIYG
jgi:uncharacterized membrane protein